MTTTAASPPRAVDTPSWWADVARGAAALSLLAVVALWVRNGGVLHLLAGGSDAVSAAGRLTGLLASDLLLLQVLLQARVPLAERAFGQDRLARWHRWTGFASCHLMLAHLALITLGYAAAAQIAVLPQLWEMVSGYPGLLLATAGTALLLMVVVTSLRAARRRLRYESWHLLHLYAYLGAGLALPHQLWTGADFLASPLSTMYWWTLYATAAGAVLVFRIGLPVWRNARHRLRVSHVVAEGDGLTSVYLTGRRLHELPVRAGQFMQWRFLDGPGWSRSHPFSLSATPHTGTLRITVKDLGDGSARVAALAPGTRVFVEGPYGRLTGQTYTGGPVVMLACGIGVTPLLALLGELPYEPGEATLIYRARSEAETAFRDELDRLAEERGVRVVLLLGPRAGDGSWLPEELPTDLIEQLTGDLAEEPTGEVRGVEDLEDGFGEVDVLYCLAPDIADAEVYVCGPDGWSAAVRATARDAGVPAWRVHTEQFAW
jgi:predicted ferric reductase